MRDILVALPRGTNTGQRLGQRRSYSKIFSKERAALLFLYVRGTMVQYINADSAH